MQCDKGSSYKPCMSTCPLETCDNTASQARQIMTCSEEPCVEGCAPEPCKQGELYESLENMKCMKSLDCKVKCQTINGIQYYEGDVIDEESCRTW